MVSFWKFVIINITSLYVKNCCISYIYTHLEGKIKK